MGIILTSEEIAMILGLPFHPGMNIKSQMYDQILRKLQMLGHLRFCQQVALLSLLTKYSLSKREILFLFLCCYWVSQTSLATSKHFSSVPSVCSNLVYTVYVLIYLYCFHKGFEIAYNIQYATVKWEENENVKFNKECIIQYWVAGNWNKLNKIYIYCLHCLWVSGWIGREREWLFKDLNLKWKFSPRVTGDKFLLLCSHLIKLIYNKLFLVFQQHKRRLYTWTSPDGQHRNQIDYILCSQRWRSSIQSAKARRGADCSSDHELLIAKFRLKLKKVGKTTRPFMT